jgi:hypothetical protein
MVKNPLKLVLDIKKVLKKTLQFLDTNYNVFFLI